MDNKYTGGIVINTSGFEVSANAPVDSRFRVKNAEGLNELIPYESLISYNEADKTYYQYVNGAWKALAINSLDELKALIATESTAAMEFKGAITNGSLPTAASKGDMYKIATNNLTIPAANNAEQTEENVVAKPGDSIVYEGENKWYLIPSGDDIEDTWRPVKAGGNTLAENETLEFVAGGNVTITETDGKVTISATDTNTHHEAKAIMGNSNADVVDETAENGEVYFNIVENGEVRSSHKIVGTGGISVKFDAAEGENGQNTITIEAAEGAKYDLAANKSATNGNVGLSLTGTDNSTDTVTVKGTEGITVTTDANGVVIVSETISAGLGDLASKDEISLSDFDNDLSIKATGWSAAAGYVTADKDKWTAAATTVTAKESTWDTGAQTAATALQTVKILGTTLNQASSELTVAAAKTALGLGTAAYESKDSFVTITGSQIISGIKTFENGIELDGNKSATLRIETTADGSSIFTNSSTTYGDRCIKVMSGGPELRYNFKDYSSTGDADFLYADENYNVTIATREFVTAQGYLTSSDISGKVDKVAQATNDNIPIFTEFGNLKDSGKSFKDLAWASDLADLSAWKENVMDGDAEVAKANYSNLAGNAIHANNADNATAAATAENAQYLGGKSLADIQGETTNTIADCVSAINTANEKIDKTGAVVLSEAQKYVDDALTWGSF